MSVPFVLGDQFYNTWRPTRVLDQNFGMGLNVDDMLEPLNFYNRGMNFNQGLNQCGVGGVGGIGCGYGGGFGSGYGGLGGYLRPWRTIGGKQDIGSNILTDKDKYVINLDVQHFLPTEILVKVNDNIVTVNCKHDEKQDEHGLIYRQFIRRYVLPKGVDVDKCIASLSVDGVLTILVPRLDTKMDVDRTINITQTGLPTRAIEGRKIDVVKK